MASHWISPPTTTERYRLTNLRIPAALSSLQPSSNGWCQADLLIDNGLVAGVFPTGSGRASELPSVDADQGILLSGLVDCHTHLDKAHVAATQDFAPGDLAAAIKAMEFNQQGWTAENLSRRVGFSLRTAFANGVRAIRTHMDFDPHAPPFIHETLKQAALDWADRVELQISPLADVDRFVDAEYRHAAYASAAQHGRLGLFLFDQPNLPELLTPIFEYAEAQGWDLDLHVDEGTDANLAGISAVTSAVQRTKFSGTVLCGHAVALSSYDTDRQQRVIAQAVSAGLHFVSLPVTNLYLQDRGRDGGPRLRGTAPVASLAAAGANISFGADNVRDPFCAFGDFDPMSVLNIGAQVAHLHEPARDWSELITRNPAVSMGLKWIGQIEPGVPADLVLFSARTSSELSARVSPERVVIKNGNWLNLAIPNFRELDE